MKTTKFLLLFIIFFSCSGTNLKLQQDTTTQSSKLTIPLENSYMGLELQIYYTPSCLYGYLVSRDYYLTPDENISKITFKNKEGSSEYYCKTHKGNQRVLLPKGLLDMIISSLKEKNRIQLEIEGQTAIIEGSNSFAKKFDTLCQKASFFDKLLEEGLEYLDKNTYQ